MNTLQKSRTFLSITLALLAAACGGPVVNGSDGGASGDDASTSADSGSSGLPHYTQETGGTTWIDACATGEALAPSNTDENLVTIDVAGFDFLYFGAPVSMLRASTNGWLSFSPYLTDSAPRHESGRQTLPNEGAPNGAVYALWEDLRVADVNGMCVARTGSGDGETLVIEWNAAFTQSGGDLGTLAFEVQLDEATNEVRILWNTITADGDAAARLASATIGIENEGMVGLGHPGTEAEVVDATPASGDAVRFVPAP